LRLKDLLGPVTRVKKKKKKIEVIGQRLASEGVRKKQHLLGQRRAGMGEAEFRNAITSQKCAVVSRRARI